MPPIRSIRTPLVPRLEIGMRRRAMPPATSPTQIQSRTSIAVHTPPPSVHSVTETIDRRPSVTLECLYRSSIQQTDAIFLLDRKGLPLFRATEVARKRTE